MVQWLRRHPSSAGDTGSILSLGSSTFLEVWSEINSKKKKLIQIFLLESNWFTVLCEFPVYSKVNQLCTRPLFLGFFSHTGHHRALSRGALVSSHPACCPTSCTRVYFENYFIYLSIFGHAGLGLRYCAWAFSGCGEQGPLSSRGVGFSLQWLLLLQSAGSGTHGLSNHGFQSGAQ